MEQTKFVHKILFHGQNCFTCCIKWPSSSTRHIWDINKSVFRLRSPPQDISWCVCKYSKFTVPKSRSIWVRDPTCTCHLLLTEGFAWFVSHWAPYWNGISISNAHARLKLWVGSYSAVSWNPEVSTMTPFRRTASLFQFRWDSERLIILGPLVLGGLGEQVDGSVDLPPCWQQNFLMTSFWLILLNFYNTSQGCWLLVPVIKYLVTVYLRKSN